jgi:hypothetical protein
MRTRRPVDKREIVPGDEFDFWVAVSWDEESSRWLCQCVCGAEKLVIPASLLSHSSKSCGCRRKELLRESRKKHGHCSRSGASATYRSWRAMIDRCYNEDRRTYARYGGRGIRVCERWRHSFQNFLDDIGERPSRRHTVNRIDNDGHYEPGNVRWSLPAEQSKNTSRNRTFEWKGETLTLTDLATRVGINQKTIIGRLNNGWPIADALTVPVEYGQKRFKKSGSEFVIAFRFTAWVDGRVQDCTVAAQTMKQAAGALGVSPRLLSQSGFRPTTEPWIFDVVTKSRLTVYHIVGTGSITPISTDRVLVSGDLSDPNSVAQSQRIGSVITAAALVIGGHGEAAESVVRLQEAVAYYLGGPYGPPRTESL